MFACSFSHLIRHATLGTWLCKSPARIATSLKTDSQDFAGYECPYTDLCAFLFFICALLTNTKLFLEILSQCFIYMARAFKS